MPAGSVSVSMSALGSGALKCGSTSCWGGCGLCPPSPPGTQQWRLVWRRSDFREPCRDEVCRSLGLGCEVGGPRAQGEVGVFSVSGHSRVKMN